MLTKAILTGGVLSVLAGSIVYFGTDGADALERKISVEERVEETELAGAADPVLQVAETVTNTPKPSLKEKRKARAEARAKAREEAQAKAQALEEAEALAESEAEVEKFETVIKTAESAVDADKPPVETSEPKPKTRWLDQYLKSNKSKKAKAENEAEVEVEMEQDVEVEVDVETAPELMDEGQLAIKPKARNKDRQRKKMRKNKVIIKMNGDEQMVWSSNDEPLRMDEDIDIEMLESLLDGHSEMTPNSMPSGGTDSNKKIRVIKMKKEGVSEEHVHNSNCLIPIDYEAVLVEAKKLQVVDMRNQAVFEIIDYAIDRGDVGNAADMIQELSSPEFRDTGRAKVGVALATAGDMTAAFAVLNEIEIDELAAPIRLEIISALMATRAERDASRISR